MVRIITKSLRYSVCLVDYHEVIIACLENKFYGDLVNWNNYERVLNTMFVMVEYRGIIITIGENELY